MTAANRLRERGPAQTSTSTAPQTPSVAMQAPPASTLDFSPDRCRRASTDPKELLTMLTSDSNEVKSLLDQGMLTAVWKPAIDTKDVALALGDRSADLPDDKRVALDDAVHRLMLAAWQLDSFGDLGDKQKLLRAYNSFAEAVQDVKAIYGSNAVR
jgi:hypothetical protein